MSISSSLNAGVAGLNANATRLATISDNIANSATDGYRRARTEFHSLVMQNSEGGRYSAGGVRTSSYRLIDEGGPLVSTSNATDLAVDGRGMLPVTTMAAVESNDGTESYPLSLMTTGSFRADENGILRTESGMALLGWPANADGTINEYSRVTTAALEPVRVNANQFAANPTTEVNMAVNLPATATQAGAAGTARELTIDYYDNMSATQTLTVSFTPTVPATGASNEWTMTIRDSAQGNAVIGEYTLVFDDASGSGGTLETVTDISGGAYDPATGTIPLTVANGTIDFNIGTPGVSNGLTQLSDSFVPVSTSANGSPVGNITSVEVDTNGDVYAIYDQGFSRRIYKVPLVDVPNVNGLKALSNQTYQVTNESGALYLWDAGDGPTGTIAGFTRQESATDVAAELTQLIQTQRAYSSNAKVIQTVDEMLQETTNIKR